MVSVYGSDSSTLYPRRKSSSLYLYAISATALICAGLILACMLVQQQNSLPQRRWSALLQQLDDAAPAAGEEEAEEEEDDAGGKNLTHVPECAADDHCRGACRMVCDEINWDIGAEDHATTLLSFGCCRTAPLLLKEVSTEQSRGLCANIYGQ
jgi:hypothetical protein